MPYDAEATRARIFAAATAEFAEHGIAGARVDRIAARAQANKASIYSYFGDKDQLFAAVLDRVLGELVTAVPLDPDRIPEYVGELFDYHLAHPEVMRLLLAEAQRYATEPVPGETDRAAMYVAKADTLRAAQTAGTIDPTLDPRHLVIALTGLVGWYFSTPQVARMLLAKPTDPAVAAGYRASIMDLARRIIAPAQQAPAQQAPIQ